VLPRPGSALAGAAPGAVHCVSGGEVRCVTCDVVVRARSNAIMQEAMLRGDSSAMPGQDPRQY